MPKYIGKKQAGAYGHAIGILLLDAKETYIPGDVGNASTYGFPVLYRIVPGLSAQAALSGDVSFKAPIVEAARELALQGVKGISSNCGFLLHYQDEVAQAVNIPVMLSSLLLIPLIAQSIGNGAAVGVVTANSQKLTKDLLVRTGLSPRTNIHLAGLENCPEFRSLCDTAVFHSEKLEAEVVRATSELKQNYPDTEAILLECALLPPYAAAVQEAVSLPVFDFVTMIDFFQAASFRKAYIGIY